jgi:hypothetical protein
VLPGSPVLLSSVVVFLLKTLPMARLRAARNSCFGIRRLSYCAKGKWTVRVAFTLLRLVLSTAGAAVPQPLRTGKPQLGPSGGPICAVVYRLPAASKVTPLSGRMGVLDPEASVVT